MSTSPSQTSAQPEAALSDWFGVEVRRPADAPTPGSARESNASSATPTSSDPGTNPYPTRPVSRPIPAHDLDSAPPRNRNRVLLGVVTLVAGLFLLALFNSSGMSLISPLVMVGLGLFRIATGLSDD
ncbi:MAG: hypothetical protein IPN71_05280 [Fibrobacteres bacterium]|nr:hypothetical protein [Fibrobacterota bacterium]